MNIDLIKKYYDKTGYMYRWFYSDKHSLGLHYGLWEKTTNNSREALENSYKEVKKYLEPIKGQTILDAGCGIGGASLWLAQNTEANYQGITISAEQLKRAREHSRKRGLSTRTSFFLMDYHRTDFLNEIFDHIFLIESSCYADLTLMTKEMMRGTKTGGETFNYRLCQSQNAGQ